MPGVSLAKLHLQLSFRNGGNLEWCSYRLKNKNAETQHRIRNWKQVAEAKSITKVARDVLCPVVITRLSILFLFEKNKIMVPSL